MLTHLIAKTKPRESLAQHCDFVLQAWATLRERYAGILPVSEDFWFQSFLSVLFHDFGKISPNFENSLRLALGEKVENPNLEHIRHELLSTVFWLHLNYLRDGKLLPKVAQAPVLAVMTHHKNFTPELFKRDELVPAWEIRQGDFDEFLAFARQRLCDYGFDTRKNYLDRAESIHRRMSKYSLAKHRELLWRPNNDNSGVVDAALREATPTSRNEYILYKALLYASDWTASGHRALELPLRYTFADLYNWLATRAKRKGIAFGGFRAFQQASGAAQGHVLAVAPTGSGKTEAALLWAANRTHDWARILYLLPTRVTSNALFERLDSYFGEAAPNEKYTAVVHSSAKLYRQELAEREGNSYEEFDYLRESSFFKPVTVATVDQLLTQGFNLGWWELKTFHLFRASVIIDEVHAYEPYTLGLLVASIRYLREQFQTRFFVMTATLPQQLRTIMLEALGGTAHVQTLEDQELLQACRNKFRVERTGVDKLLPEIKKRLQQGHKVLLVVNTVNEAIRLYKLFEGHDRMCYHSRFIVKHRFAKEQEIEKRENDQEKGFLLIATQVAEVSLDIDYDFLYTENAPMDALIQRAGRVNRKRLKLNKDGWPTTEVVVFQHTEASEKYVYSAIDGLLVETFKLLASKTAQNPYLTEQNLLDLVDSVYKNYRLVEHEDYQKGLRKHIEIQRDTCGYLQDYNDEAENAMTREGLDSVSIIPMEFRTQLRQIKDKKEQAQELAKHEVSIRRSLYHACVRLAKARGQQPAIQEDWHEYLQVPYSEEVGVYLSSQDYEEMKIKPQDPDLVIFMK